MHDPMIQAFCIRYPWPRRGERSYHAPFLTIWHKDPEKAKGRVCRRRDDTCGWGSPSVPREEWEAVEKLAKNQYAEIFARSVAERENKSYAFICHDQDLLGALYWVWRAIKQHDQKKVAWQYGQDITFKEFQNLYRLCTCPVDNFQSTFKGIKDEEGFTEFFMNVYRNYLRFHRPWYKHPRWHIHHWSIQFHPWQNLKRRYWDKCCLCNKRGFPKGTTAIGNWSGDKIWHEKCEGSQSVSTAVTANSEGLHLFGGSIEQWGSIFPKAQRIDIKRSTEE